MSKNKTKTTNFWRKISKKVVPSIKSKKLKGSSTRLFNNYLRNTIIELISGEFESQLEQKAKRS